MHPYWRAPIRVRPPLVSTALSLLPLHPRSSILSESLVRLLNAALGAKPLRAPLLVSGGVGCPSVPALVAQNLSVTPQLEKTQHMLSRVSRPVWFELASSLEKLSASDKQAAEKLNAEPSWVSWFCMLRNHEFFCEVDPAFIQDRFNLYGLKEVVGPLYGEAMTMILGYAPTGAGSTRARAAQ